MEGIPLRDGDDAMTVNWLEIAIANAKGNVTYLIDGQGAGYEPRTVRPGWRFLRSRWSGWARSAQ
jgi:hypothetical protein